jgi:hypothetical protein
MRIGTDKEELERLLRFSDGEWVVSSNIWGCPVGQSNVYLKRKVGKLGGLKISECIPNDEAKRLKHELREYLRQRKL